MTRLTVAALCAASLTAWAAGPKRPAAIGSAKEDEPCPVVAPATTGADLAFLRGVQWAFEPAPVEVRTQAIEDLGFLGDPRALNALAALVLDPNLALSRAAIRAVATIRHPRAEEILANVVRHPSVTSPVKQYALSLIPFQNTPTALRFVHQVARWPSSDYPLLQVARALSAELPVPTPESALPLAVTPPSAPAPAPLPLGDTK